MKKLLVASTIFLSSVILAQTGSPFTEVPKTVSCGSLATIVKALTGKDIGETPVWIGRDENGRSNYAVFMNDRTGSFTILQFNTEVACILGAGNKSEKF
jgi:hypothetical protein